MNLASGACTSLGEMVVHTTCTTYVYTNTTLHYVWDAVKTTYYSKAGLGRYVIDKNMVIFIRKIIFILLPYKFLSYMFE